MKILKRTAHFDNLENASAPLASQNIKLNIPKKTKLFVDQTLRERENCTLMHRVFQHDLYQLRLNTARSPKRSHYTVLDSLSSGLMLPPSRQSLLLSLQTQKSP